MPTTDDRRYITVQRQHALGSWLDVGHILIAEGNLPGGFRYADNYQGPPLAPDLDYRDRENLEPRFFPIMTNGLLHLRKADQPDLHGVFQEALPGRWGENVMISHVPAFGKSSPAEKLWMMGDRLAGGLRFEAGGGTCGELWIEGEQALVALRLQVNKFVEKLAQRMRPDPLGDLSQRWALTSNGGQTPKCAFLNGNVEYIAKFSTTFLGTIETTRVERGMAEISKLAGLDTADTTFVELDDGDAVLLSRRFDVDEQGRRIHKINAATALGMPIAAQLDYADVVKFLREHSSDPEADVREMFGRMLLNVFANNTDDHLGQFEFLADGDQWRLAPNFDVLVDELDPDGGRRPHAMRIAGDSIVPTIDATWIDEVSDSFGLESGEGREIAARIAGAMERFPEVMRSMRVSEETIERYLLPAVGIEQLTNLRETLEREPAKRPTEFSLG
ncbi:MAG: HipA domain-containing protein [Dokdonella sp.]